MPTKFLIVAVTVNAAIGQLLLKRAMADVGAPGTLASMPAFFLDAVKSPWIYSALAVQVFGYVLWMIVVSRVKLGVATASAGAGFYVLTALSAWAIYGESLSFMQWLGIALITIGVTCVSLGPA